MGAATQSFSVMHHDWHSHSYVEEWIERDRQRDEERRARLKKMLAVATLAPDAAISVLDVGGGYGGFFGLWLEGWLADRIGRHVGFVPMLIEGAVFMTLWVNTDSHLWLWVFGLAWSFGFLGFWGPSTTAEVFPNRIRGAANGMVWGIAYFVGFVLWPFVTVHFSDRQGTSHRHSYTSLCS
jgi:MFS family permease